MVDDEQSKQPHEEQPPSVEETSAAAKRWAKWAKHDFEHFLDPLAEAVGLSRQEALLYILGERLGEIADSGVVMHIVVHQPDSPEDDEPWKRGKRQ